MRDERLHGEPRDEEEEQILRRVARRPELVAAARVRGAVARRVQELDREVVQNEGADANRPAEGEVCPDRLREDAAAEEAVVDDEVVQHPKRQEERARLGEDERAVRRPRVGEGVDHEGGGAAEIHDHTYGDVAGE